MDRSDPVLELLLIVIHKTTGETLWFFYGQDHLNMLK